MKLGPKQIKTQTETNQKQRKEGKKKERKNGSGGRQKWKKENNNLYWDWVKPVMNLKGRIGHEASQDCTDIKVIVALLTTRYQNTNDTHVCFDANTKLFLLL